MKAYMGWYNGHMLSRKFQSCANRPLTSSQEPQLVNRVQVGTDRSWRILSDTTQMLIITLFLVVFRTRSALIDSSLLGTGSRQSDRALKYSPYLNPVLRARSVAALQSAGLSPAS